MGGDHILQLMGLIEDHPLVLRDHLSPRVPDGQVGEKEVVVDHHHLCLGSCLAHVRQETPFVIRAFSPETVIAAAAYLGPGREIIRHPFQLGAVAGLGPSGPRAYLVEARGVSDNLEARLLIELTEPATTEIVFPAPSYRRP